MKRTSVISIFLCVLLVTPAYPYWVWTPKTKKWTNPKSQVKPSPKEQFNLALEFYELKKYEEAKREFLNLIKKYPKSLEASEAQYYLGLLEEEQDNLYGAYQAYQRVVDKYPFSERIQQVIEREYKIAEKFMSGERRKVMGKVPLPVENPAVEIFTKVIENSTFGPNAANAQYKLGLVLKGLLRYSEAEEAFNKVISNYPDSPWVEAAKFQLALCRAAVSRSSDYDQGAAQEAKEKFEAFVKEHPDAVLSKEAEDNIRKLKEKESEASFNIGRFYEKQKEYDSAKVYYEDVISNGPNSIWAAKAMERLSIMEKQK